MYTASLQEYEFNRKNSRPHQKETRLDPGWPATIAIDIKSIQIELKDKKELELFKVGKDISFEINELIQLDNEGEYFDHYAKGGGNGEISSIDQWEYKGSIMLDIELEGGYGEDL